MMVEVKGVIKDVEGMGEVVRVVKAGGRTLWVSDGSWRRGWMDVGALVGREERYTGEASKGWVAGDGGEEGEVRAVRPRQC